MSCQYIICNATAFGFQDGSWPAPIGRIGIEPSGMAMARMVAAWPWGMKREFVDRIVHQHLEALQQVADDYLAREQPLGSPILDPALELPANIQNNGIHRQPRGFAFEYHERAISAGALYNMDALIGPAVAAGRGRLGRGRPTGDFLRELVRQGFSEARVQAVDCVAGLLRWAFVSCDSPPERNSPWYCHDARKPL